MLWIVVLLAVLMVCAERFFCPTLEGDLRRLKLPNVAVPRYVVWQRRFSVFTGNVICTLALFIATNASVTLCSVLLGSSYARNKF
jgi:hypothetical protein